DQLVFGRRLYGQVGGLLALEDAIDIAGGKAVLVDVIGPIRKEADTGDGEAIAVDRGQLVPGGQRDDETTMNRRRCARCHDQTAIRGAGEGRDRPFDLAGVTYVDCVHLDTERRSHSLDG